MNRSFLTEAGRKARLCLFGKTYFFTELNVHSSNPWNHIRCCIHVYFTGEFSSFAFNSLSSSYKIAAFALTSRKVVFDRSSLPRQAYLRREKGPNHFESICYRLYKLKNSLFILSLFSL